MAGREEQDRRDRTTPDLSRYNNLSGTQLKPELVTGQKVSKRMLI